MAKRNPLFSLDGKVALVTGGSRGLGWGMAEALANAGAHVVLNGRNPDALQARADGLRSAGLAASVSAFDVADIPAGKAAVEALVAEHGRIDILINNAGINIRKSTLDVSQAEWQEVIDVDLTACFMLAKAVAGGMVERRSGRIINIGSVMSILARPTIPAYAAAKSGLWGLTRVLAAELGPHRVTANAIAPGFFATDLNLSLTQSPEFNALIKRRVPMGRWGQPAELGGAAVYLASRAASYVNGHLLYVDGGAINTV